MIYKTLLLLEFLLIFSLTAHPQSSKEGRGTKLFKRAMFLAEQRNYQEAIDLFKIVVEHNPKDLDALFNMGLCYLNTSNGADTAVVCFNKGLDILTDEEKKGYIANEFGLSIGMAYQVLLQPLKAIDIYEELIMNMQPEDSILQSQIEHEIQTCHNANFFLSNPIDIKVQNMGSEVNSMYDDHSPLVAVSEHDLFFTSRRNWIKLSLLPDGQYAEKIYSVPLSANNWESARLLKVFFKQNEHEAAASLSPDGDEMVLFRNDEHGKSLYLSNFEDGTWTSPEKLPFPINSYAQETHGSISADKSTLFFTSDRDGGFGGLDIYMVKRNMTGMWGEPRNLGPNINTQYDEETPMVHYDGRTLYFSSEGHNSMGRLDVFYAQMEPDSSWSRPVNLGYPINTPDDDFFFVPSVNKSHAYYASSKFDDNYGGSDIYRVEFETDADTELAVVEGSVNGGLGDGYEDVRILVTRRKDNVLVGDYRPSVRSGKYMMFLEIGYEYEVKETNSTEDEKVAFVNVTTEMSYKHRKQPIVFNEVAMDAPLMNFIEERIIDFTRFSKDQFTKEFEASLIQVVENDLPVEQAQVRLDKSVAKSKVEKTKAVRKVKVEKSGFVKISDGSYEGSFFTKNLGYTVQLLALKKGPVNENYFKERGLCDIYEIPCIDGYIRYTYGVFNSYKASLEVKRELRKTGMFTDIWIRPIKDINDLKVKL